LQKVRWKLTYKIKPMVIDIFKNYFLILDYDLIPMLSGFISSLLCATEEQDEKIQNMINEMLFQINQRVGDKFYISTLWLLLLKNSKNRIATFKVLFKKFAELSQSVKNVKPFSQKAISDNLIEISNQITKTNGEFESFYPNTTMISNAFAMCLEDEDMSTRKNCLDFIIKYIDLNNDILFDDYKRMIIFDSLMCIMDQDDLSIIRRVFKMLFDANDLNVIEKNPKNLKMMDFFGKAMIGLLKKKPTSGQSSQKPFRILKVLNKSNENLTRHVLKVIAISFSEYIFYNGYSKFSDFNHVVVEQTKTFIKDFEVYLEDFLESINLSILDSPMTNEELVLMEFVVKVLVIESNIPTTAKFKFMINLMDSIFKHLDKHFEGSLMPRRASVVDKNETAVHQRFRFEKIIHLLSQSVIILEGMTKSTRISINSTLQLRIRELLIKDTELLDKALTEGDNHDEILNNYSPIFSILMEIDALQNSNDDLDTPIDSFSELPKWLQCQFKFLQSKDEKLSFSALNFIFSLFDSEKKSNTLQRYNNFIYRTKAHYESGNFCWIILSRIVEMIEIYDFKKLALKFFFKLISFNLNFISKFLLSLLATRKSEDFNKVSLIWNCTSSNKTSDISLVLQETVFEMLKFIDNQDLMTGHYFKSWINHSNDNLAIILQTILKSLIKYTSWQSNDDNVIYKIPFDCNKFIQSLNCLVTVYDHSTFNFLNFITITKIPIEFEFFDEEMTLVLKGFFACEEKNYFSFIMKILLRYTIGSLDSNASADEILAVNNHNHNIHIAKEAIIVFLEKLLRSLEKKDVIHSAVLPLIRIISYLIERSFIEKNQRLQITHLTFLQFLIFKTGLVSDPANSDQMKAILMSSRIMPAFLLSLKSESFYVVKEFVKFGGELNLLLAKYLKSQELFKDVNQIIFFYLDSIINRLERTKSMKEEEEQKAIITELMSGLKFCLTTFLQVDEIEEKIKSGPFEQAFFALFTLGMIQPKEETKKRLAFMKDENTSKQILSLFEKIFSMLSIIWKSAGLVQASELYVKHDRNSDLIIKDDRILPGISKQIIEIIKPLSDTFLEVTAESLIENWIANNQIMESEKPTSSFCFVENAKILEIILHLQIPPIKLLYSLLNGKQAKAFQTAKRYIQTKKDKDLIIIRSTMVYECSFLSFLLAYLKFLPKTNEANFELCGIIVKILKMFDTSVAPAVICWLLDIIDLTIEKFPIDFNHYGVLKNEWATTLADIISRSLKVILKEANLSYRESEKMFKMATPFCPSIEDYLQRIEEAKIQTRQEQFNEERRLKSGSHYSNR
jgi:hypothetical protein